jgi:xylan 1,4-beta-xylosidase
MQSTIAEALENSPSISRTCQPGASFVIETLDKQHGDAVAAWEAMGKPEPPNQQQTQLLREEAWATRKDIVRADSDGNLHIETSLPPWALMSIRQM